MSTKDAERARVSSELRAGRAVAAGALLAGPLSKRSDWLHTRNKRFCVLTTAALSWHKDSGLEAVSDSRVLRMHSKVHLKAKDGLLCIEHSKDQPAPLWFSAASEPELRVWHRTLRALVDSLDAAARIARVHIHENGSRFSAAPFTELPHTGSRNLREGRLAKPYLDGAATRLAARAEVAVLAGDQVETVWVSTAEVEPPLPERLRLAMVVDAFVPQALDARGRPMPGDACNC